ncbi:non-specific lipid transfer protein GPI-anchored 5-like [Panicum virgatum]|uniref:Bifunctional inhibitor/plant lipid transfer protein/seed storage helical domain-containing protein n=1 Tax=Panicum virgatum TaxID=38727 RepID=A0A8T0MFU4_PANVG|nr:non-specific lipid transfer protein GPI-anchored 5-like [Panicum virgatum]KAG2536211.1 hypothetical protein PVAP13_9NG172400 [Panicum virgatum]
MAQRRQRGFPPVTMPCLALAVTALMCAASTTTAQPQAPPLPLPLPQQPATTTAPAVPSLPAACPPAQASLSPCLGFFIGNSSSPPAECCAQIRAMFQSQAPCLCAAMASGASQLGSAIGQLLPSSCDLPANACSGSGTVSGAPAGPTTTPASSGSGTTAAAAPGTGPTGADTTAPAGGGGVKSVPGVLGSGAAAAAPAGYRGVSAAAALVSLLVAYLL